MNTSPGLPSGGKPDDPDLAKQAIPGHGVPSQDPNPAAQIGLTPEEARQESKSVLIGGGVVAGLATGAAVGAAVAGPVGIVVGATVGAVGGAIGSTAVGAMVNPESNTSATVESSELKDFKQDTKRSGTPR